MSEDNKHYPVLTTITILAVGMFIQRFIDFPATASHNLWPWYEFLVHGKLY